MERREKTLLAVGVFVAFAALAAIAWRAVAIGRSVRETSSWVALTHEVLADIEKTRTALYMAESGRRGYVLAQDEQLLTQYQQGIEALRIASKELHDETSDNPRQVRRVALLAHGIEARRLELEQSITSFKTQPENTTLHVELTRSGRQLTQRLEKELDAITNEEQQLLLARKEAMENELSGTIRFMMIGGLVSVVLLGGAFVFLLLEVRRRATVEAKLRDREARLARLGDSNIIGMITAKADGAIIEANDAFLELAGYSRADLQAGAVSWDADRHALTELATRGVAGAYEKEYQRKDGSRVPVLLGGALVGREKDSDIVAFVLDQRTRRDAQKMAEEKVVELERWTKKINVLNEMSGLLQTNFSRDEATRIVAHYARLLFPEVSGALGLMRSSKNSVEQAISWLGGISGETSFAPETCWALRTARTHRSGELHPDQLRCSHSTNTTRDLLCLPIAAGGEILGHLALHKQTELSDVEYRLALAFADTIALAEANFRLHEKLRTQAIRDPLTGLFNRRYMEESAERELKRAERSNQPVGVIMLDVDHFKRFNDEYGHSAGDQVMRELGALLLSKVRGEDIVCRYGGEEIAIILPNANAEIVAQRAESLRAAIKSLRVAHGGRMLGALTASFGVAAYPEHGKTCAELVRRADRALYEAKRSGRDRVVVFDGVGGTFDLGPRPVVAVAATH